MNAIFYNDFDNSYIPHILQEIYIEKVYDRFLSFLDKKTSVVLDIGANIGLFSNFIKDFSKTVYALEPSKQHFECLSEFIKYNKIDSVIPANKALYNIDGKLTLKHTDNTTMFSIDSIQMDTKDTEEVDTITLKTFVEENKIEKIDFMKLDVEGSEFKILTSDSFKDVRKIIKCMVIEYHQWTHINPNQLLTMLKDYGFKVDIVPAQATLISAIRL